MSHVMDYLPQQAAITRMVLGGESVLLFAPRYHGKRNLLQAVEREARRTDGVRFVRLSTRAEPGAIQLDYGALWADVADQLDLPEAAVSGVVEFEAWIQDALDRIGQRIIFTVIGSGRGREERHRDVLAAFHRRLRAEGESRRLVVLATDDYSLFRFAKTVDPSSEWPYLKPVHWRLLERAEVRPALFAYLRDYGRQLGEASLAQLAELLVESTGGHVGLLQEAITAYLDNPDWDLSETARQLDPEGPVWRDSSTLQSLEKALEEDPVGYTETALEYELPSYPEGSVRVDMLRQLGVLQRVSAGTVRLCPGVIRAFVRLVKAGAPRHSERLGSLTNESGTRVFVPGPLELDDDSFVVVHLSDLHIGSTFRFKLAWGGGTLNPGEPRLPELLAEDLSTLGLAKRIDALVVSGDITSLATPGEFSRARELLEELLAQMGLDRERIIIIPGNHDVAWHPDALSEQSRPEVSRENYDNFVELLRGREPAAAGLVSIPSRSGTARLRIVELDSNYVEGPEAGGIGYVSTEAMEAAGKLLANDPVHPGEIVHTWIAVHHHIFPVTRAPEGEAARRHVSVMANSSEILEFSSSIKAEIILHGHEHQPGVSVARRWPVDRGDPFKPITVVGAGSISVSRDLLGPFSRNHYFVICRRPDAAIVRSRRLGDAGVRFVTDADMHLGGDR